MMWLLGFAVVYLFCLLPNYHRRRVTGLFAHRGLFSEDQTIPENTLAAFAAAVDHGYGMELDVQLSRDGFVYVYHDNDLNRLLGIDQKLGELDHQDIDALLIKGHHIPLFADLLALVAGREPLIVELKSTGNYRELCEKTTALLADYPGLYCVESFDPRIVYWFRRHRPDIIRGQLMMAARSYKNPLLGFLISSMLINFMTRPDFMAIDHRAMPFHLSAWVFHLLGGTSVGWTIHRDDKLPRKFYDAIIFEHYLP